jgi:hypothetical protein
MAYYSVHRSNELYHHGILGQKWGVRRYQNEDGTYTSEGAARRKRFGDGIGPFQMFKNQIARSKNYYKLQRSKPIEIKKDEKPLSELMTKKGYTKGAYGYGEKKVNGVTCVVENDNDTSIMDSIINSSGNYFSKSPIEKAVKDQVNAWANMSGQKVNKYPKLGYVSVTNGNCEASFWYDSADYKDDVMGGHDISVEFDPKTKKVYNTSVNG